MKRYRIVEGSPLNKQVIDDNFGSGYELAEALKILQGYAAETMDVMWEDDENVAEEKAWLKDEHPEDDLTSAFDWYKGEGYYLNNELVYREGDVEYHDRLRDMYYFIEGL